MHGTSPGEISFPLTSFGGLVALAAPESLPENASPRTWNSDYLVGIVGQRDGLRSVYSQTSASVGPNSATVGTSPTWNNPSGVVGSTAFASFSPVSAANSINATGFGFVTSAEPVGIVVEVSCHANALAVLFAQILVNGIPAGEIKSVVVESPLTIVFGSSSDLWGLALTADQVNNSNFGVQFTAGTNGGFTGATEYLQNAQITLSVNAGTSVMQPLETFTDQNGMRYNLVTDLSGNLWVESLDSNPGELVLSRTGINPNSKAIQLQGQGVDYLSFFNPGTLGGSDMPLAWTPTSQNRITQVGPGAPPVFTPSTASDQDYPILSITQPAAKSQGFSYYLQSAGPGSSQPGNVVTFYYLDSTTATQPDQDLVTAFNSGNPVYAYVSFTGTPAPFGPQVVLITSVGDAEPPGQPRSFYYFTFQVASTAYTYFKGSGHSGYTANYQRTLAMLTVNTPIPNAVVGSQIVVTGVTPSNWNATWTLTQTPNASEMVITGSQVTAGVATFNYAVTNGTSAPAAGAIVTITNTLNADGQLNVTQWPITSVSGGLTGTFVVQGYPGTLTASFQAENGYADTAGTIFCFDPGAGDVGSSSNPIFGNAGAGGDVVFNPTGLFIDPGTYQGTVFFILPDGSFTQPAPPVVFTVPDNTTQLVATLLPIGPPNVVGRGIAITEAGQNGVPGANFFTLPTPVVFYNDGSKFTATSFYVQDNTSTSVNLFFTSDVLNSALAIDTYGYNLFNCYEIPDCAWIADYASRNCYGQPLNRVQNLLNMSFDGGYLASTGRKTPLGWQAQDSYGTLTVSARFGNAWYIQNTGLALTVTATQMTAGVATYTYDPVQVPTVGGTVTVTGTTNGGGVFNVTNAIIATVVSNTFTIVGLTGTFGFQSENALATVQQNVVGPIGIISQSVYQDAFQENILEPNTGYSVRVWARSPSGANSGSLVISLVAGSTVFGSAVIPISELETFFTRFIVVILPDPGIASVPPNAQIEIYAENTQYLADVEIDRIDLFETDIPVLTNTMFMSYAGLPTMVDAVTGQVVFSSENQQPVNMATVLYDTLYAVKGWSGTAPGSSLYSLQSSAGFEPADWNEPEVSQRSGGAVGPFAWAGGEQWFVGASRAGVYLFVGGQPGKIIQELQPIWDQINWSSAQGVASICLNIDLNARRMLIGVPMSTPNFWLPFAPQNPNPTAPNVWMMCNFQGLDSGEEVKAMPQMHTTMFGALAAIDMRRKWNLWYSATNPGSVATVQRVDDQYTCFGNGIGNSKVYQLDMTMETDDGYTIDSGYTTAGLPNLSKRETLPQLGPNRVRWTYFVGALTSGGLVNLRLLGNKLFFPEPAGYLQWTVPGGFTPGLEPIQDTECSLNFVASRTFDEFRQNDGQAGWTLSNITMRARKDVWNAMRGAK